LLAPRGEHSLAIEADEHGPAGRFDDAGPVEPANRGSSAREAALKAATLTLIGGLLSVLLWPQSRPWSTAQSVWADFPFCVALLVHPRAGRMVGIASFLACVVVTLVAGWMLDERLARAGVFFDPFIASKIAALCIALIAPGELWVAVLGLVATAA